MQFLAPGKKLILASKSPRRQQLLRDLGYEFEVRTKDIEEIHHPELQGSEIAEYLARLKAEAFAGEMAPNEIVLTSDTVVWCDGVSLAKAQTPAEAQAMLHLISGKSHEVITGVCLFSLSQEVVFSCTTKVYFKELTGEEINYYISNFQPFDKAGAYGIQEWIGMWAIEKIEGSYFNVVGLPTHLIHEKLKLFKDESTLSNR